jgi:hypothetical protein
MHSSSDVWFCSYLMHRGFQIYEYSVMPNHKVKCTFQINDEEWKKLKLEFNHSDLIKFKTLIEQIKDLGY